MTEKKPRGGRHAKGLLRPHVWITGTDPNRHQMYNPWQKMKAQAVFRKESWHLTFDDFFDHWNGRWHLRGRRGIDLAMSRINPQKAWRGDNVHVLTRQELAVLEGHRRKKLNAKKRTRGMDIHKRKPRNVQKD